MSLKAASVKNRAGYIVEAIRENYEDPELQLKQPRQKLMKKDTRMGNRELPT